MSKPAPTAADYLRRAADPAPRVEVRLAAQAQDEEPFAFTLQRLEGEASIALRTQVLQILAEVADAQAERLNGGGESALQSLIDHPEAFRQMYTADTRIGVLLMRATWPEGAELTDDECATIMADAGGRQGVLARAMARCAGISDIWAQVPDAAAQGDALPF